MTICISTNCDFFHNGEQRFLTVERFVAGLSNTATLSVSFFTTKSGGSGIGLAFCRQIVEAHGGTLTLENCPSGFGCEAPLPM